MTPNDRRMRITGMEGAGTITILPPGTPLIAGIDKAAELFSVSATTLRRLYAMHEDFPAGKLGENNSTLLFDVARCYAWLARYLGTDLGEVGT